MAAIHFSISYKRRHNLFDTVKSCFVRCQNWFVSIVFFFYDVVYNILILYTHNRFCRAHTYTDIIWWIAFGWNHGRIIKKRTNGRTPWLGIMAGQGIPTAATCCSIAHIYIYTRYYSTTYHSMASECLQNIRKDRFSSVCFDFISTDV